MNGHEIVLIARCPEHGLHGERDTCYVCGGAVQQVPMILACGTGSESYDGEDEDTVTELLVTLQMCFPTVDRQALAAHIAPVVTAAIAAGGKHTSISVQPYEHDDDQED